MVMVLKHYRANHDAYADNEQYRECHEDERTYP